MVWNIFIDQLGWLSGCAPSQLLHTCSSAEYEKLEKVLDFIATAENTSVTNILLLLNLKHSSYWEGNEVCCSRNQDKHTCHCDLAQAPTPTFKQLSELAVLLTLIELFMISE